MPTNTACGPNNPKSNGGEGQDPGCCPRSGNCNFDIVKASSGAAGSLAAFTYSCQSNAAGVSGGRLANPLSSPSSSGGGGGKRARGEPFPRRVEQLQGAEQQAGWQQEHQRQQRQHQRHHDHQQQQHHQHHHHHRREQQCTNNGGGAGVGSQPAGYEAMLPDGYGLGLVLGEENSGGDERSAPRPAYSSISNRAATTATSANTTTAHNESHSGEFKSCIASNFALGSPDGTVDTNSKGSAAASAVLLSSTPVPCRRNSPLFLPRPQSPPLQLQPSSYYPQRQRHIQQRHSQGQEEEGEEEGSRRSRQPHLQLQLYPEDNLTGWPLSMASPDEGSSGGDGGGGGGLSPLSIALSVSPAGFLVEPPEPPLPLAPPLQPPRNNTGERVVVPSVAAGDGRSTTVRPPHRQHNLNQYHHAPQEGSGGSGGGGGGGLIAGTEAGIATVGGPRLFGGLTDPAGSAMASPVLTNASFFPGALMQQHQHKHLQHHYQPRVQQQPEQQQDQGQHQQRKQQQLRPPPPPTGPGKLAKASEDETFQEKQQQEQKQQQQQEQRVRQQYQQEERQQQEQERQALQNQQGKRTSSSRQEEVTPGEAKAKKTVRLAMTAASGASVEAGSGKEAHVMRSPSMPSSIDEESMEAGSCSLDGDGGGGGGGGDRGSSGHADERARATRERNRANSKKARERKKALVESLKKQVGELGPYRHLVDDAHDLISAHSGDANAVFTYASTGFKRLLGIDPARLLRHSLLSFVHPKNSSGVLRCIMATVRRGGTRQVWYHLCPPPGAHSAEVETAFRVESGRLLAVTRVRSRSDLPVQNPTPSPPLLAPTAAA